MGIHAFEQVVINGTTLFIYNCECALFIFVIPSALNKISSDLFPYVSNGFDILLKRHHHMKRPKQLDLELHLSTTQDFT